jgi:mono/diheme cytochrome c family protein
VNLSGRKFPGKTTALLTIALLVGIAPVANAQAPRGEQSQQAASAGDAAKGKHLYTEYGCYQCHGREGQGGVAGPRIAPNPIALPALTRYVRQPGGQMPPYTEKVVSDAELADIHAFLRSIPQPRPARDIPLLNN